MGHLHLGELPRATVALLVLMAYFTNASGSQLGNETSKVCPHRDFCLGHPGVQATITDIADVAAMAFAGATCHRVQEMQELQATISSGS